MKKIKNYLLAALGFSILTGSLLVSRPLVAHSQQGIPQGTPVTVTNTPLPVELVTPVEPPECCVPKHPFGKVLRVNIAEDAEGGEASFAVPAGKRLVIEHVSGSGAIPQGQKFTFVLVQTNPPGAPAGGSLGANHYLVPTELGTVLFTKVNRWAFSQPMRIYADAGSTVVAIAARSRFEGKGDVDVTISGFLADAP